jgi:hypothetical protein
MQKNQKITAEPEFAFDCAETAEKNKLVRTQRGLKQYFFLFAVSPPSLTARKFRLGRKNIISNL